MSDRKLLIVEDDAGLCSQYRWAFPGYTLFTAQDRTDALALLKKHRPAVVVTDLGLPPRPRWRQRGLRRAGCRAAHGPGHQGDRRHRQ